MVSQQWFFCYQFIAIARQNISNSTKKHREIGLCIASWNQSFLSISIWNFNELFELLPSILLYQFAKYYIKASQSISINVLYLLRIVLSKKWIWIWHLLIWILTDVCSFNAEMNTKRPTMLQNDANFSYRRTIVADTIGILFSYSILLHLLWRTEKNAAPVHFRCVIRYRSNVIWPSVSVRRRLYGVVMLFLRNDDEIMQEALVPYHTLLDNLYWFH